MQIDQDGIINGARWTTVALLDGVHTGEAVKITFDTSLPSATPTVTGFALTAWDGALAADFNGDRKADIIGQNDSGLPSISTMNGTSITSLTVLQDVGPTWHVKAAADFNGDGKADILWQNDNGHAGDLDHERHHPYRLGDVTERRSLVACQGSGRFQRRRQGRYSLGE